MKILLYGLVGIVAVLVGSTGQSSGAGEDKLIVGWVEKVRLFPGNVVVHAKVDTGADNSSLNVPKMKNSPETGPDGSGSTSRPETARPSPSSVTWSVWQR